MTSRITYCCYQWLHADVHGSGSHRRLQFHDQAVEQKSVPQYTKGISRFRPRMNSRYGSPMTDDSVRSSTRIRYA